MEFKRIPKNETCCEDKYVLEMDFYEANELLCLVLPPAIADNIESFKWNVQNCPRYARGDKQRIRALRRLRKEIQETFNKMFEEK